MLYPNEEEVKLCGNVLTTTAELHDTPSPMPPDFFTGGFQGCFHDACRDHRLAHHTLAATFNPVDLTRLPEDIIGDNTMAKAVFSIYRKV
jgi:hypothetical protein